MVVIQIQMENTRVEESGNVLSACSGGDGKNNDCMFVIYAVWIKF